MAMSPINENSPFFIVRDFKEFREAKDKCLIPLTSLISLSF